MPRFDTEEYEDEERGKTQRHERYGRFYVDWQEFAKFREDTNIRLAKLEADTGRLWKAGVTLLGIVAAYLIAAWLKLMTPGG